jgi:ribosomal protein S18 acetylase RimI-like enzyme
MFIKQATQTEVSELVMLNDYVQKIHADAHPDLFKYPTDEAELTTFFDSIVSKPDHYCYIAYLDDQPVGYLWAAVQDRQENPFKFANRRVYINHVAVHDQYRRHHVRQALFARAGELAKTIGITKIALDVWAFNDTAQTFFKKQGFSVYNFNLWRQL